MRIRFNLNTLKQIKWNEYLTRFLLGGAITVITGLIAKHFGPVGRRTLFGVSRDFSFWRDPDRKA
jgi:hypothetical protein